MILQASIVQSLRHARPTDWIENMSTLFILLAIIAIILLFVGGFVKAVGFLLWVGLVLLIISVIAWLLRYISGRRAV